LRKKGGRAEWKNARGMKRTNLELCKHLIGKIDGRGIEQEDGQDFARDGGVPKRKN